MAKRLKGDKNKLSKEDIEEISTSQGCSVEHVKFVLECYKKKVLSIDQPNDMDSYEGDDPSNSLMDTYASEEKSLEQIIQEKEDRDYLISKIKTLSNIEQEIINDKFFGDTNVTCQDLADKWNVSKQRISQILIGAMEKLKKKIKEDNLLGNNDNIF